MYESNSVVSVGAANTNTPDDSHWWVVATLGYVNSSGHYLLQFAYQDSSNSFDLYTRKGDRRTLVWSSWKQIPLTSI